MLVNRPAPLKLLRISRVSRLAPNVIQLVNPRFVNRPLPLRRGVFGNEEDSRPIAQRLFSRVTTETLKEVTESRCELELACVNVVELLESGRCADELGHCPPRGSVRKTPAP